MEVMDVAYYISSLDFSCPSCDIPACNTRQACVSYYCFFVNRCGNRNRESDSFDNKENHIRGECFSLGDCVCGVLVSVVSGCEKLQHLLGEFGGSPFVSFLRSETGRYDPGGSWSCCDSFGV